ISTEILQHIFDWPVQLASLADGIIELNIIAKKFFRLINLDRLFEERVLLKILLNSEDRAQRFGKIMTKALFKTTGGLRGNLQGNIAQGIKAGFFQHLYRLRKSY